MAESLVNPFSLLDQTSLVALLLHVGPHPRDLVNLRIASKTVNAALDSPDTAKLFASIYFNLLPSPWIDWVPELKKWFRLMQMVYDPKIELQGSEVRQMNEDYASLLISPAFDEHGSKNVTIENITKMSSRLEPLSLALEIDDRVVIIQPKQEDFPWLPLHGRLSTYYEITFEETCPKHSGPTIGFALKGLNSALPGRAPHSFGLSIDSLMYHEGPATSPVPLNPKIIYEKKEGAKKAKKRLKNYKPRKGDTWGVGVVVKLARRASDGYPAGWPCAKLFYITFNGHIVFVYESSESPAHMVPTIAFANRGEKISINFGAVHSPGSFERSNISTNSLFKTLTSQVEKYYDINFPLKDSFYPDSWVFNPREIEDLMDANTNDDEMVPLRSYYRNLEKQAEMVPIPTIHTLFTTFGTEWTLDYEPMFDFFTEQVKEHHFKPVLRPDITRAFFSTLDLLGRIENNLLTQEQARSLVLDMASSDDDVNLILEHEDPLELLGRMTSLRNRRLATSVLNCLITYLEQDPTPVFPQKPESELTEQEKLDIKKRNTSIRSPLKLEAVVRAACLLLEQGRFREAAQSHVYAQIFPVLEMFFELKTESSVLRSMIAIGRNLDAKVREQHLKRVEVVKAQDRSRPVLPNGAEIYGDDLFGDMDVAGFLHDTLAQIVTLVESFTVLARNGMISSLDTPPSYEVVATRMRGLFNKMIRAGKKAMIAKRNRQNDEMPPLERVDLDDDDTDVDNFDEDSDPHYLHYQNLVTELMQAFILMFLSIPTRIHNYNPPEGKTWLPTDLDEVAQLTLDLLYQTRDINRQDMNFPNLAPVQIQFFFAKLITLKSSMLTGKPLEPESSPLITSRLDLLIRPMFNIESFEDNFSSYPTHIEYIWNTSCHFAAFWWGEDLLRRYAQTHPEIPEQHFFAFKSGNYSKKLLRKSLGDLYDPEIEGEDALDQEEEEALQTSSTHPTKSRGWLGIALPIVAVSVALTAGASFVINWIRKNRNANK